MISIHHKLEEVVTSQPIDKISQTNYAKTLWSSNLFLEKILRGSSTRPAVLETASVVRFFLWAPYISLFATFPFGVTTLALWGHLENQIHLYSKLVLVIAVGPLYII